jgi:hypothetical protein
MGPLYACAECRTSHHACGRCGAAVDESPHAGLMDAHGATIHRCTPLSSARAPEPHECTCGATVYYYRLHEPWLDADGERHGHIGASGGLAQGMASMATYGQYGGGG